VELQSRLDLLKRQGLGLVAISYDPPEVLQKFAASRGITFPLVSDVGSTIIKRYGLLNTTVELGTRTYGIPFPGTFIVDRKGTVRSRHFESAYQERRTVASILAERGGASGTALRVETAHLTMNAVVSDNEVAPGKRISLVFDITPRSGMHVYAPGNHSYQIVRVTLEERPWLLPRRPVYPASEIYHFKPLNERVEVFQKSFRLVQDLTILATQEVQKLLADVRNVTIAGRLEYQACDDRICYTPQSVPITWTLSVQPLDRRPPGSS
jgi:hypothetical protein